jgi:hypothetical protein
MPKPDIFSKISTFFLNFPIPSQAAQSYPVLLIYYVISLYK